MAEFFLRIYDWLKCRKGLAALIVAVCVALCVLSMSRLDYEEDITAMLFCRVTDSMNSV